MAASATKWTEILFVLFAGCHSFSIASYQEPCEKLLWHYRSFCTDIQQIWLGLQDDKPPLPSPPLIWMEHSFILGWFSLFAGL